MMYPVETGEIGKVSLNYGWQEDVARIDRTVPKEKTNKKRF